LQPLKLKKISFIYRVDSRFIWINEIYKTVSKWVFVYKWIKLSIKKYNI